ncbi:MAG: hypothetical protein ACPGVB_11615 [Chitinophagales bacterium]
MLFNKKDFIELAKYTNDNGYPLISIYTPTHRAGKETWNGKDALKLKNIVLDIKNDLSNYDLNTSEIQNLLKPVVELYEDREFWLDQSDGLAIFLSKDYFKFFKIPINFEDRYYINSQFHVKPLVSFTKESNRFFFLDLNQQHIRLFECLEYSITEIEISDVIPRNIEEALPEEHHSTTLQAHSGGSGDSPIYHGQGGHKSEHSIDIEKFFRLINDGIEQLLHDEKVPLLLGGVDYLIPMYHAVSTYNFLVKDRHVSGNLQNEGIVTLHEKAWSEMSGIFETSKKEIIKRFGEIAHTDLGTTAVEEVVKAAVNGRIDTLFLKTKGHCWGKFDQTTQKTTQYDDASENVKEKADLLNFATIQCIENGGKVYLLEEEDMPSEDTKACAILRY